MEILIEQNDYSLENCDLNICVKAFLEYFKIWGLYSIKELLVLALIG